MDEKNRINNTIKCLYDVLKDNRNGDGVEEQFQRIKKLASKRKIIEID